MKSYIIICHVKYLIRNKSLTSKRSKVGSRWTPQPGKGLPGLGKVKWLFLMVNRKKHVVYSEIPFSKELISFANEFTGFCIIKFFTKRYFQTDGSSYKEMEHFSMATFLFILFGFTVSIVCSILRINSWP